MDLKQDDASKRGSETYHRLGRDGPYDALDWASLAIVGPLKWQHHRTINWCNWAERNLDQLIIKGE